MNRFNGKDMNDDSKDLYSKKFWNTIFANHTISKLVFCDVIYDFAVSPTSLEVKRLNIFGKYIGEFVAII
jgi:hypothetical protein